MRVAACRAPQGSKTRVRDLTRKGSLDADKSVLNETACLRVAQQTVLLRDDSVTSTNQSGPVLKPSQIASVQPFMRTETSRLLAI